MRDPLDTASDPKGHLAQRYDLQPGPAGLIRPDQHFCPTTSDGLTS